MAGFILECMAGFVGIRRSACPDVITLENVPRLAHLTLWRTFVSGLEDWGYHVKWGVLDAAEYGVPQSRRRLVLLASKLGPIELPARQCGTPSTVRDAIGDLPPIGAGEQSANDLLHASRCLTERNLARIKASKPAGTWREWPAEMRVRCHRSKSGRTYPSVYGRMSWDKPAPTVTTQFFGFGNGRFGHPEQDRAITLREGAVLQSFPMDFNFTDPNSKLNFREIGRLIGNAVPPALGMAIGRSIITHVVAYPVVPG